MPDAKRQNGGSWTYVLDADRKRPVEQQSVFTLRPLTGGERDFVTDNSWRIVTMPNGSVERVSRMRTVARELVLTNVESIERFPISAPRPWPADREARQRYLDELLEDDHIFEIGNEVFLHSKFGPEEAKQVGEY